VLDILVAEIVLQRASNLPIPAAYLPDAAVMLDRIAAAFKLAKSARPTAPRVRCLFDARIETILCRLSPDFSGELTSLQVEAGKLVARIYGEYHHVTGQPRRSCASPHYERAFAGRSEIYRSDEDCARAENRYTRLQDILGTLATPVDVARARAVLETLCVDNLPIDAAHLPGVSVMLDRIAAAFNLFESA
jgi:hypothetical protein